MLPLLPAALLGTGASLRDKLRKWCFTNSIFKLPHCLSPSTCTYSGVLFIHLFVYFRAVSSLWIQLVSLHKTLAERQVSCCTTTPSPLLPQFTPWLWDTLYWWAASFQNRISCARSLPGRTQRHKQIGSVLTMSLSGDASRAGLPGTVGVCPPAWGPTSPAPERGKRWHWGCAFFLFFP